MSSDDNSIPAGKKKPGKSKSPPLVRNFLEAGEDEDSNEPTDLVISIKTEPVDDGYEGPCRRSDSDREDEADGGWFRTNENDKVDRIHSDHYTVETLAKTRELLKNTRLVLPPHIQSANIQAELANGESGRSLDVNKGNYKTTDPLAGLKPKTVSTSKRKRVVPIKIKSFRPIPIALTVSSPEGREHGKKNKSSALSSQATAHHLMTLATEADKILKKRKKSTENMSMSENDDDDEGKNSNSEDDLPCSLESDSSGGGMDPFLNYTDQTMTLIQRRAAEASLSAAKGKKSKRKRSQLPDDLKDQTYWERRRKNNEAAKRSRDARRAKEDQIAIRAALLEQENMRLRIEVAALKEETVKLRGMLYEKR